uniref:Inter-alpha-trypsin inhibitor heavy chain n=3 Tax=Rhizophora mucronata TaxID=61149 RepID=A0A2P2JZ35_RHIMU
MFSVYLFPGALQSRKAFRKEIVFVVDISGSMEGKPLEGTKDALFAALSELDPTDSFNIIAFNGEIYLFSSSMQLATKETIASAIQWTNMNFIAGGGTNILLPLNKAIEMVSNAQGSIPVIFLVTDGSVEDERHICDVVKSFLRGGGSVCPRLYTFGIGSYCNHYFLKMLAILSRGQYDAAYDVDLVESQMQRFFRRASSTILANIALETFDDLDDVEVYPSYIPDLSSESPLAVSGRYQGDFPDIIKAKGILGDLSNFVMDLKIQKGKDIPLDKVFAKQEIDLLTAQAWFSENKLLEDKVAKISIQSGVVSEYTCMALLEAERQNEATNSPGPHKESDSWGAAFQYQRRTLLCSLCVGFGNLTATAENTPAGVEELKLPEAAEIIIKAASHCCGSMWEKCCCLCCIQCCSKMNDQCALVFTQLFTSLACFGCLECCSALCCGDDGK